MQRLSPSPRRATARLLALILLVLNFLVLSGLPGATRAVHAQGIIYVNDDATGANTGADWANAYTDLQGALSAASEGKEIWVAAGEYNPAPFVYSSFQLKNGVAIYGGFAGNESSRTQRDWIANVTLLNGNFAAGSYVWHVVWGELVDETTVLDGFTITGGNANDTTEDNCPYMCGGGIYLNDASPTLANLIITGNRAKYGAGMLNNRGSNPTLTNVTFSNNTSPDVEGWGGGMYNFRSSPTLNDVIFSGNYAYNGGAIANFTNNSPTLTNVTFSGNHAYNGGAIYSYDGNNSTLINVTFSGNHAEAEGGAIFDYLSRSILTNATLSGNHAYYTGAIYSQDTSLLIQNSIIWGNRTTSGPNIGMIEGATAIFRYSLIEGGLPPDSTDGGNNLNGNPLFVRAVNCGEDGCGDDPTSLPDTSLNDDYGDLRLQPSSPAIDVGDNAADLNGNNSGSATIASIAFDPNGDPRIAAVKGPVATVDMGAYERINTASAHTGTLYLPAIIH